jgi:hypothetical protein
MLEWILEHKLFSGLGTALIMFVIGKLYARKIGTTQKQKSGHNSTNIQAGGNITLGKPEDK